MHGRLPPSRQPSPEIGGFSAPFSGTRLSGHGLLGTADCAQKGAPEPRILDLRRMPHEQRCGMFVFALQNSVTDLAVCPAEVAERRLALRARIQIGCHLSGRRTVCLILRNRQLEQEQEPVLQHLAVPAVIVGSVCHAYAVEDSL